MRTPRTPAAAHSTCGHNADVAAWTYRTPRVVTGSSCAVRGTPSPAASEPTMIGSVIASIVHEFAPSRHARARSHATSGGFSTLPGARKGKNPPEGDRRSARRGQLAEPYVRYSLLMSSARNGGRPSGRTSMIEAAERVARRDGPGAVTVEAVIREAGVSRGGLMYHFPSKLD